jgi:plastocyanin
LQPGIVDAIRLNKANYQGSSASMSDTATAPVIAGLAVGIALVVVLAVGIAPALNMHYSKTSSIGRTISEIVIPKGASSQSGGKNFEPSTITVIIGVNNTVRWTNNDDVSSSVVADNATEDPDFAADTQFAFGSVPANATNYLQPGQSFEFTFNRPGEFHYHSEPHPWLRGIVIVLSALPR